MPYHSVAYGQKDALLFTSICCLKPMVKSSLKQWGLWLGKQYDFFASCVLYHHRYPWLDFFYYQFYCHYAHSLTSCYCLCLVISPRDLDAVSVRQIILASLFPLPYKESERGGVSEFAHRGCMAWYHIWNLLHTVCRTDYLKSYLALSLVFLCPSHPLSRYLL